MNKNLRNKIISEYLSGKGSTTITKELKVSKPTILKILKEEGITRKRDRCKSLNIFEENDKYFLFWECKNCGKTIKRFSNDKVILCRNHFRQKNGSGICKKCSLDFQVGKGNPFYGKKHTEDTKTKVSKSRTGKYSGNSNHMKKSKYKKLHSELVKKYWDTIGDKKKMSDMMKQKHRDGLIKNTPRSKDEKEIVNVVRELGYEVKESFRIETKIFDLYVPKFNLIIEYNGDYWHCNPKKYHKDYFNKKKNMTAKELWRYDKLKLELAKKIGYNLEVVWESDYKENKNIINKILTKYARKNYSAPERSREDQNIGSAF